MEAMGGLPGKHSLMQILVVCTANQGRSPATAQLLTAAAARRGRDDVRVHSAGLMAADGLEMLPSMRQAMVQQGLHVNEHYSHRFDELQALACHLVITMSADQRKAMTRLDPSMVPRCYTLLELVRLVTSPHWRAEWNGRPDVVAQLHRTRPYALPGGHDEDIPDPARGGPRLARSVLSQISGAVRQMETPLFGEPVADRSRSGTARPFQ